MRASRAIVWEKPEDGAVVVLDAGILKPGVPVKTNATEGASVVAFRDANSERSLQIGLTCTINSIS